jgi:hypothetical protein
MLQQVDSDLYAVEGAEQERRANPEEAVKVNWRIGHRDRTRLAAVSGSTARILHMVDAVALT